MNCRDMALQVEIWLYFSEHAIIKIYRKEVEGRETADFIVRNSEELQQFTRVKNQATQWII